MRRLLLPATLGLAHGVADGAAGLLLGGLPRQMPVGEVAVLVLLYNLLAFACQPVFGALTDHWRKPRVMALAGLGLLASGLLLAVVSPVLGVAVAGSGSGVFHVAGGALALCATRGKASGPGLFAAPGVLGLALGGFLALRGVLAIWPFLLGLAVLAVMVAALKQPALPYVAASDDEPAFERHDLIMIALLAAIALRSLVWTTVQYVVAARVDLLLLLAVAGAVGKMAGGPLADRLGWRRWTLLALGGSAALLTVAAGNLWVLMLGVALLQSATPAALAATLRLMPRRPATAAGLGFGLAIALGGLPLMAGWGGAIASPPVLAGIAAGASVAGGVALTVMQVRRQRTPQGGVPVGQRISEAS
jgi:FSR family fosmidomycin resistance protein-like MFS transporter